MNAEQRKTPNGSGDFLSLFTASNRIIFHFILTMIPDWNDAQDVMQETSRVLWEKFASFEPGTDFVAWALTVARYQVLNYRKKRRRDLSFCDDDLAQWFTEEYVPRQDRGAERIAALRRCMTELKETDRRHLQLRFQKDYSPKRLAQRLKVSVKRIYRNEGRIMGLLLRCIRRRLFEEGVLG